MRHAHTRRSAARQRSAPILWDHNGELRRLNPNDRTPKHRYGREFAGNPPDNDRDERAREEDQ